MSLAKRLLPIVFVVALTLGLASQALAGPVLTLTPAATVSAQAFTCLGSVTAVDPSAGTVTVAVRRASLALQGALGQSLTLSVTRASALAAICHGAQKPVTLAHVPVGDLLAASGTTDATIPAGLVYDIGKACVWKPSFDARFLCLGTVSSVDLQAGALVVQVARGSSGLDSRVGTYVNIGLRAGAKIFTLQRGLATATTISGITAGDRMYITGHADFGNPGVPVFAADLLLVCHVAPVNELKWFACCGHVREVDHKFGMLTVTIACGTLGVPSGPLTLATTAGSVIRTLSKGVLATVSVADVSVGESIVVTGVIDRSDPNTPVYDIGHAFIWQTAL